MHDRRGVSAMPDADPTQIMRRTSRVMQTNEDNTKSYRRVMKKPIVKSGSVGNQPNLQVSVYNCTPWMNKCYTNFNTYLE